MIEPQLGLSDDTRFSGQSVGNSPYLMYVDDAFERHKAIISRLNANDPLMACSSTTDRLDRSYLRLLDPEHDPNAGVPTEARIVQDIIRCMGPHLKAIIDSKGTVVPNMDFQNGHRRLSKVNNQGGKRNKSSLSVKWIHDDAKDARNALIECSLSRKRPIL
ncbi:hypothetical protein PsorP6_016835 [Peronosclerospora sorghi]|uniref:Uncharacterized protein n=1 Tax=Peronosclerospora sorghi TaxID=230839 RepID=A0ACC0WEE2_9STRA|nr:hypothetical protein PsorP6_016835 [Peronosclerospora sorghi]